jgi:hypothetical protein
MASVAILDGRGKQVLDPQQGALPRGQGQQAVDVGMLAGVLAGVVGVLGVQVESLAGGLGGDGAVDLSEMVVDRQRAGLARFVFDGRHHGGTCVKQLDRGQVRNARQLLQVVGEGHFRSASPVRPPCRCRRGCHLEQAPAIGFRQGQFRDEFAQGCLLDALAARQLLELLVGVGSRRSGASRSAPARPAPPSVVQVGGEALWIGFELVQARSRVES